MKTILLVRLRAGLHKVGVLAKMLSLQFCLKGCVGGLGVDGLLLKDWQDAHWLLEEFKARSKIHAKVTSHPDDSFAHVFLLFQDEPTQKDDIRMSI